MGVELLPVGFYEKARKALAEARCVDEVKEIHDQAAAMQEYARRANDPELLNHATEIRLRARRKFGQMMAAQKAAGLMAPGTRGNIQEVLGRSGGLTPNPPEDKPITLAELGAGKSFAHRARTEAAMSDEEHEAFLQKAKQRQRDAIEGNKPNRTSFMGDPEWFTPAEYIELARGVLGTIELDPASHPQAQKTVRAEKYFTLDDNGLKQKWAGKVWLNPPYAQPAIGYFINKLLEEITAERVKEAILLTNNYTDSAWFHKAARASAAVCFTHGRIQFVALDVGAGSPTRGHAFFYFGRNPKRFMAAFREIGLIMLPGCASREASDEE